MDNKKLLKLASTMRLSVKAGTRTDGDSYYYVSGDKWMHEVCREAHSYFLPDDHKYRFIVETLDLIIDNNGEIDSIDIESDINTIDLLAWLSSSLHRIVYVDDASAELGVGKDAGIVERVAMGQYMEKREVFDLVVQALQGLD